MKWLKLLQDYQFYLKIEKGLAKNSIDSYTRDV
ncbi:MAG: tyrosine recombinase XerD, partial [Lutibacter sp.]|nr:tyrosine recombinase XerD [Lutibacter sp.]